MQLSQIRKREIQRIANEFLDENKSQADVFDTAKALGFKIASFDPKIGKNKHKDGLIIVNQGNNKINTLPQKLIATNESLDYADTAFTVAHELGHYRLHYDPDFPYVHISWKTNGQEKPQEEREADFFAACVVMPEDATKAEIRSFESEKGSVLEDQRLLVQLCLHLSKVFKVSGECAAKRYYEVVGC